jgi:predicted  nucleic acid-binding Zn-ribbon protein
MICPYICIQCNNVCKWNEMLMLPCCPECQIQYDEDIVNYE